MTRQGGVRMLTPGESALVAAILDSAALTSTERERIYAQAVSAEWTTMSDGGMGSLARVLPAGCMPLSVDNPSLSIGEVLFDDADGVSVSATLTVDSRGCVHELDVWKADFSALKSMPDRL